MRTLLILVCALIGFSAFAQDVKKENTWEVVTLGTGHGDPTITRYQTSILLKVKERYYLIDAGDHATSAMVRHKVSPAQLHGVFLTHMHLDHSGGLLNVIAMMIKYRHRFPQINPTIFLPDRDAPKVLQSFMDIARTVPQPLNIKMVVPGKNPVVFDDGVIKVTIIPNKHIPNKPDGTPRSYSLKLEGAGKSVLFSGDLSSDWKYRDFPAEAAQGCDAVFSEFTHFRIEAAMPIWKKLKIGRLILHHVANRFQKPEGEQRARKMLSELPYPFEIAADGQSFKF